jgi:hypothetical protein
MSSRLRYGRRGLGILLLGNSRMHTVPVEPLGCAIPHDPGLVCGCRQRAKPQVEALANRRRNIPTVPSRSDVDAPMLDAHMKILDDDVAEVGVKSHRWGSYRHGRTQDKTSDQQRPLEAEGP